MKSLYVFTLGCQMNTYDSELFYYLLSPLGYEAADSPESADLVIVNTCAIRAKAEDKAFSFLGRFKNLKLEKPGFKIGIAGCIAQQEGEKLFKRVPYLDFIMGTQAISRLAEIVETVLSENKKVVDTDIYPEGMEGLEAGAFARVSDFVTIMRGCDNFCTYCVVPYVRGRETSRAPEAIIKEINLKVAAGAKEITLLGQNVNSYGKKEGLPDFPELLYMISEIKGLKRLRFATSHPKDLSDELIRAFKKIPQLCPYLHLPVQSGSSRILAAMNRRYTREHYLELIFKLRETLPEISLGTDIITGFPGESIDDFEKTLSLVESVGYDSLFAFIYSDRPNARARNFPDKLSEKEKKARLATLLGMQNAITREKNEAYLNREVEVLIEGKNYGKADSNAYTGRIPSNRLVHIDLSEDIKNPLGKFIRARIDKALGHSLLGSQLS